MSVPRTVVSILCVMLISLGGNIIKAQPDIKLEPSNIIKSAGLEVTLSTDKASYNAAEQMEIVVGIKNTSEDYLLLFFGDYALLAEGNNVRTFGNLGGPRHLKYLHQELVAPYQEYQYKISCTSDKIQDKLNINFVQGPGKIYLSYSLRYVRINPNCVPKIRKFVEANQPFVLEDYGLTEEPLSARPRIAVRIKP